MLLASTWKRHHSDVKFIHEKCTVENIFDTGKDLFKQFAQIGSIKLLRSPGPSRQQKLAHRTLGLLERLARERHEPEVMDLYGEKSGNGAHQEAKKIAV